MDVIRNTLDVLLAPRKSVFMRNAYYCNASIEATKQNCVKAITIEF